MTNKCVTWNLILIPCGLEETLLHEIVVRIPGSDSEIIKTEPMMFLLTTIRVTVTADTVLVVMVIRFDK